MVVTLVVALAVVAARRRRRLVTPPVCPAAAATVFIALAAAPAVAATVTVRPGAVAGRGLTLPRCGERGIAVALRAPGALAILAAPPVVARTVYAYVQLLSP